jgi:hypothetical protein
MKILAERGGFELPEPVKAHSLSRRAQSTTLPPLRIFYDTSRWMRWGPVAGDPSAAIANSRGRISRAGRLPSIKLAAAMRLRILSLPVSRPRWQCRAILNIGKVSNFTNTRFRIQEGAPAASVFPSAGQTQQERRAPGALRGIGLHGCPEPSIAAK